MKPHSSAWLVGGLGFLRKLWTVPRRNATFVNLNCESARIVLDQVEFILSFCRECYKQALDRMTRSAASLMCQIDRHRRLGPIVYHCVR